MSKKIRVTIWNEFRHERHSEAIRAIYPEGLHAVIGEALAKDDELEVRLAALDDPDQGLPADVLNNTDVLIWWGHMAHHEVNDALVEAIKQRVYLGKMGLVVLHSGHHSKVFRGVVGTSGNLSWGRNQKEIVWTLNPAHPIAAGIPDHFCLAQEELYAEPFYIGEPDETVFASWFEDGFVMRSGVVFKRSAGKITRNAAPFITNGCRRSFATAYTTSLLRLLTEPCPTVRLTGPSAPLMNLRRKEKTVDQGIAFQM